METILGNVKEVIVNWYYTTEFGEEYISYHVKQKDIRKIIYHEKDKFCAVHYWDGSERRVFSINEVVNFSKKECETMYDRYDNSNITLDAYVENFYK